MSTRRAALQSACIAAIMSACAPAPDGGISVSVTANDSFTGRANADEVLLDVTVTPKDAVKIKSFDVTLTGEATDVSTVKLVSNNGTLSSKAVRDGRGIYKLKCNETIDTTRTYKVCVDIRDDAVEGNKVSARLNVLMLPGAGVIPDSTVSATREILLVRRKLFGPGDYGSKNYRIPAIYTLADGTLLTATDKRKNNQNDLPDDIDVITSRSLDGGLTWSEPVTVEEGKGFGSGFGDAALVTTASGDVICAYSGGSGIWASNEDVPTCNYIKRSCDNGTTWEDAVELHGMFWGKDAIHEECRDSHSAFFGSGRGLRLEKGEHAGRVMFVIAIHSHMTNRFDNYIVYSDDEGQNWNMSELAFVGGDEAKVVELPDGRILLSVRRSGERGFNISEDGGVSWGKQGLWPEITVNACDGDIISVGDSLLLHSVPNSMKRENVSIFVSRDNGCTWPYVKSICPYDSVYSSLTVLPDGSIGAYIEESVDGQIEMWFMNFSLDWLLNE